MMMTPTIIREAPPKVMYGAFHVVKDVDQLIGIYDTVEDAQRVASVYRTGYVSDLHVNSPSSELFPVGAYLYSVVGQFHVAENIDVVRVDPEPNGYAPSQTNTVNRILDEYWEVFVWASDTQDAREQAVAVVDAYTYGKASG